MYLYRVPTSSVVKNTARTALCNRWPTAATVSLLGVFAWLILLVITDLLTFVDGRILRIMAWLFSAGYGILVLSPLFLGIVRFFWRLADSQEDDVQGVFYYFSSFAKYLRSVKLSFALGIRFIIAGLVCLSPYFVVHIISGGAFYQFFGKEIPLWVPNLLLIESFLHVLGIVFAILYCVRYYLAPVLAVCDDQRHLLEAIHISCMVSKRSGSAFLSLVLSLFLWMLLSLFIAPALYTLPLLITCYVVHCRFAMVNYNLEIEELEKNSMGTY